MPRHFIELVDEGGFVWVDVDSIVMVDGVKDENVPDVPEAMHLLSGHTLTLREGTAKQLMAYLEEKHFVEVDHGFRNTEVAPGIKGLPEPDSAKEGGWRDRPPQL